MANYSGCNEPDRVPVAVAIGDVMYWKGLSLAACCLS